MLLSGINYNQNVMCFFLKSCDLYMNIYDTYFDLHMYVDIQTLRIVEDPFNRSANIGSNVTFNCTAIGDPKPTITWIKYNDTDFLKDNPRAKAVPDLEKWHSQLIITGVATADYGKYQCVARNNAGVKTSRTAFLSPGIVGKTTDKECN